MNRDLYILGHRLKIARMEARMTIRDVSRETGITEATISRLERGLHAPALYTVTKFAKAVGISMAELFKEIEERK